MRDFFNINNRFHLKRQDPLQFSYLTNENLNQLGGGFLRNLASLPSRLENNDFNIAFSCLNDTEKLIFDITQKKNCMQYNFLMQTENYRQGFSRVDDTGTAITRSAILFSQ